MAVRVHSFIFGGTKAVPPSHQIRISPEKSEFDANLMRRGLEFDTVLLLVWVLWNEILFWGAMRQV